MPPTSYSIDQLLEITDIARLRQYLSGAENADRLRTQLYAGFLRYSCYRNVREWNIAVRLCEALAIIGWGQLEPLEAVRSTYFNGNPETYFIDRYSRPWFFNAVWSRRKDGLAIDYGRSLCYGAPDEPLSPPLRPDARIGEPQPMPLCGQRNWIPKNPIRIVRGIANCYESSRPLIDSIERNLMPALDRQMRPQLYGDDLNTIIFNLSFSFYDNYHCKTNYIIADESLKIKRNDLYAKLLELYSPAEIEDNGYYLRHRYTYTPFRADTGTTRVNIVFEREFSLLPLPQQRQLLASYINHALNHLADRLTHKINYNFPLMLSDFNSILATSLPE